MTERDSKVEESTRRMEPWFPWWLNGTWKTARVPPSGLMARYGQQQYVESDPAMNDRPTRRSPWTSHATMFPSTSIVNAVAPSGDSKGENPIRPEGSSNACSIVAEEASHIRIRWSSPVEMTVWPSAENARP